MFGERLAVEAGCFFYDSPAIKIPIFVTKREKEHFFVDFFAYSE